MKRTLLLTSLLLLLGILVGSTAAMATSAQPAADVIDQDFQFQENNITANETEPANETIGPGARLSGIIGAQQAELRGAVSERAFGLSVAAAVSNGSKARLIENQTDHLEARLHELENESATLEEAYQNGTVSNGTYQARSTTLTAHINALERRINQTSVEGQRLPATVRAAHGVNMTRLAELRMAAGNATGPEMASIARSIAGPSTGHPAVRRGPPTHAGPSMGPPTNVTPGEPGNTTFGPPNNTRMGPPNGTQMGAPNNTTRGLQSDRGERPSNNQTNTNKSDGKVSK